MSTEFIDHNLIAEHATRFEATTKRLAQAQTCLADAKRTHESALRVSRLAVDGLGEISPLDAEKTLICTATELTVAEKVYASADASHQKARAGVPIARGLAHRGLYLHGVALRIAACALRDKARATLLQADADYQAANDTLRAAHLGGCPHMHGAHELRHDGSESAERGVWTAVGVDPEKGVFPWDPGAY